MQQKRYERILSKTWSAMQFHKILAKRALPWHMIVIALASFSDTFFPTDGRISSLKVWGINSAITKPLDCLLLAGMLSRDCSPIHGFRDFSHSLGTVQCHSPRAFWPPISHSLPMDIFLFHRNGTSRSREVVLSTTW